MQRIQIENGQAIVAIGEDTRILGVTRNSHNQLVFAVPQYVGIRIGRQGTKIWISSLNIYENARWKPDQLSGQSQYVLGAYSPLNSINRGIPTISIVDWWDKIPDELKSRR